MTKLDLVKPKGYKIRYSLSRVGELLAMMEPRDGEERNVCQCGMCGQLFGRRFVPFGLGHGLTIKACWCQLTGHRPYRAVASRKP